MRASDAIAAAAILICASVGGAFSLDPVTPCSVDGAGVAWFTAGAVDGAGATAGGGVSEGVGATAGAAAAASDGAETASAATLVSAAGAGASEDDGLPIDVPSDAVCVWIRFMRFMAAPQCTAATGVGAASASARRASLLF